MAFLYCDFLCYIVNLMSCCGIFGGVAFCSCYLILVLYCHFLVWWPFGVVLCFWLWWIVFFVVFGIFKLWLFGVVLWLVCWQKATVSFAFCWSFWATVSYSPTMNTQSDWSEAFLYKQTAAWRTLKSETSFKPLRFLWAEQSAPTDGRWADGDINTCDQMSVSHFKVRRNWFTPSC